MARLEKPLLLEATQILILLEIQKGIVSPGIMTAEIKPQKATLRTLR